MLCLSTATQSQELPHPLFILTLERDLLICNKIEFKASVLNFWSILKITPCTLCTMHQK